MLESSVVTFSNLLALFWDVNPSSQSQTSSNQNKTRKSHTNDLCDLSFDQHKKQIFFYHHHRSSHRHHPFLLVLLLFVLFQSHSVIPFKVYSSTLDSKMSIIGTRRTKWILRVLFFGWHFLIRILYVYLLKRVSWIFMSNHITIIFVFCVLRVY